MTTATDHPVPRSKMNFGPPPPDMPIPDRLNLFLVLVVFLGGIALLWLASRLEQWYAILGVGIVFSYLMLTNYALLHEATHGNLHSNPRLNYLGGQITGALFPIPFSMIYTTHQGHHLRNRTDHEIFDLYYPTDSRFFKYVQWYGILCGLFWPWIPIAAVLFALCPKALRVRFFRERKSYKHLLGDIQSNEIRAIRWEVLLIAAFFCLLFWLLKLKWQSTLVLYACFSINWSTRQYVGHAFSKRDVIHGAWNLRHNRLLSWILLHGEWDLNHHRRPDVSWYYLPRLSDPNEPRPSYFKHYWRQWLGPQPVEEPAPETLKEIPLSVHQ